MERDKELYERQIKIVDAQIDKLVYELYGLTEEEIRKCILEQYDKDPLVKKVVNEALKRQWIEEELLPNKDLVEILVSVMRLSDFVSDIEAKHYFKYIVPKRKDYKDEQSIFPVKMDKCMETAPALCES
ncbi:MAG TPA: hypothetical protein VMW67_06595 [Desulfobacteria bacterium]|nr:hypothetical protein [Desulfobacteria bacterium]